MLAIFILLIGIIIALQIPSVQSFLAHKLTDYLSKRLNHKIEIDRISIDWFDEASLHEVVVYDVYADTMIYSDMIQVDYSISDLYTENGILFDRATCINPKVNLQRRDTSSFININIFIAEINEMINRPKRKKIPRSAAFSITDIEVYNGFFSYSDHTQPHLPSGRFDHNYFSFKQIDARAGNLYVLADTFNIDVRSLSCVEPSIGLPVEHLETSMRMHRTIMAFNGLHMKTEKSQVSDTLQFHYNHISQMSHFVDSVEIHTNLDSTFIHSSELSYFEPRFRKYNDTWGIKTNMIGTVSHFNAENIVFSFGRHSVLKGQLILDGLPDIQETLINLDITKSRFELADLRQYIPEMTYPRVEKFGTVQLKADFFGFPKDFVAHGNFFTDLGHFYSDLKFLFEEEMDNPEYSGELRTNDFHIGEYLNRNYLGNITMDGKVKGVGFDIQNARIEVNADVSSVELYKYKYKNIKTNALIEQGFFKGLLNITDPNLTFSANGTLDLRDGKELVDITAMLDKANLKELKLAEDTTFLRSNVKLDFTGLHPDRIEGEMEFLNSYIYHIDDSINFEAFHLSSQIDSSFRTFRLESSFADFYAEGDFQFRSLYKDLKSLINEYQMTLTNESKNVTSYYSRKDTSKSSFYHVDYNVHLKEVKQIQNVFFEDFYISDDTKINGNFIRGKTSIFNVSSTFDSLRYKKYAIKDNKLEIYTSKLSYGTDALSMFYLQSDKQYYDDIQRTRNLDSEIIWYKDKIEFNTSIYQYKKSNYAKLAGELNLFGDSLSFSFNPSEIYLDGEDWHIADNNQVLVKKKNVHFEHLRLSHENQRILINGDLSKDPEKTAVLLVENFELYHLNNLINTSMNGEFSGNLKVSDIYSGINIEGRALVKDLKIENVYLGQLDGLFEWQEDNKELVANASVVYEDNILGKLKGKYQAKNKKSPLQFKANFDDAPVSVLSPVFEGNASNVTGKASGTIGITGTLKDPDFKGVLKIKNGGFKINYLNTSYVFEDNIYFNKDSISVKNLVLYDTLNNRALINGGLSHRLFSDFKVDVKIDANNLLALNTDAEDNELFYGIAFGTGDVGITGTFSDLYIRSNELTSNKGTKIYIPLDGYAGVSHQNYIKFINPHEQKKEVKELEEKLDLSGITMDMNFNITNDAYFEIIFDKKAGDIIRGNGQGKINMVIDTRGDFNMSGDFDINRGTYNFTLVNLINKEFQITDGSYISWSGDPYQGNLHVNAAYRQYTSLAPILDTALVDMANADVRRRYPVSVNLYLEGVLLTPEIQFDIEIEEYPNTIPGKDQGTVQMDAFVSRFINQLKNNEQELNRQVFSLMVLKQLSPPNSFAALSAGRSAASNSVSELLSNQFSYWLSQVDENLEVSFDLNTLDEDALNTFRLRLSYSILDGRIRITRDGDITNVEQQSDLTSIFGEWTVEYLITDDGKLRMKAYNRTNQNNFSTSLNQGNSTLYGFSLMFTESFNNLNDLFSGKKQKKKPSENRQRSEARKSEDPEILLEN